MCQSTLTLCQHREEEAAGTDYGNICPQPHSSPGPSKQTTPLQLHVLELISWYNHHFNVCITCIGAYLMV